MRTLNDLRVGESGYVSGIKISGALKRRLLDMGITPGEKIALRRVAPLGDPLEVSIRGYCLSLRRAEAEIIEIGEEVRKNEIRVSRQPQLR